MKNSAAAKEVLKECIKHGVLYNYYSYWSKTNIENGDNELGEYQKELAKAHKNKYFVLLELCLNFGFNQNEIFDEIQKRYDEKQARDMNHPTYKG